MYVDRENLFSNAQALTVTAASTDIIDLGQERRLGVGEPMCVVIGCDVAMGGTTPTMIATLQSDDNAGFSSATSVVVSPTFSSFAAGAKYVVCLLTKKKLLRNQKKRSSYQNRLATK